MTTGEMTIEGAGMVWGGWAVISREGKEPEQGVARLDDGTLVVVERAKQHIGAQVAIQVASTLQMASGRMVFGNLPGDRR